jgi:hypothetical protein
MNAQTSTRRPILFALLGILLFLILVALFWLFTVDDAYITFRYADNLARGLGAVYNVGERVEGYTSLSWMLLMAGVHRLGWDPALAAKLLGLVCSLLALVATYRLARYTSRHPRLVGGLATLGVASHAALALNTVVGLEMPLYTLLLVLAVLSYLGEEEGRGWWRSTLILALAALTRPEGLAVFGLTWLYQVVVARERWPRAIARLGLFAAIVGSHLLWRQAYYGDWLPATYYAKTGDLGPRLRAGVFYFVEFLIGPGMFLFAGYLVALRRRPRRLGYLLWLCGGYAAIIVWEGGDWMPGLRFWTPILPLLYLILAESLANGYDHLRSLVGTRAGRLASAGLGVLAGLYLLLAGGYVLATWFYADMRASGYREAHHLLATWLSDNTSPDGKVALMDIGIVGYYTRLPIIDLAGLTDTHIAHAPGGFQEKVYDPAYVLDQEPEYVILVSLDGDSVPDFFIDQRIYNSPLFHDHYEYAFKLTHMGNGQGAGYYLLVFRRKAATSSGTGMGAKAISQTWETNGHVCLSPRFGVIMGRIWTTTSGSYGRLQRSSPGILIAGR